MYIPETLSSNPKWAEWIERLPDIVAACAKRWDLRLIKWGLVLALIWARWSADTPEKFWRTDISRAQALDQLL